MKPIAIYTPTVWRTFQRALAVIRPESCVSQWVFLTTLVPPKPAAQEPYYFWYGPGPGSTFMLIHVSPHNEDFGHMPVDRIPTWKNSDILCELYHQAFRILRDRKLA